MGNLDRDLYAYSQGSIVKAIATILFDTGFKATMNYRLASFLHRKFRFWIIPRWLCYRNRKKYAIDIDFRADIGPGLKILHGVGIVIGYDVKAGQNLTVYQGVTLGGNSEKTKIRDGVTYSQPWLGDYVKLFANCTLLGPVYVGEHTCVGAGTLVMKDIPPNSNVYQERILSIKENFV